MSASAHARPDGHAMTEIELQSTTSEQTNGTRDVFGNEVMLSKQFGARQSAFARHGVLFKKNMKLKMRGAIKWCTFCETIVPVLILGLLCIGTQCLRRCNSVPRRRIVCTPHPCYAMSAQRILPECANDRARVSHGNEHDSLDPSVHPSDRPTVRLSLAR